MNMHKNAKLTPLGRERIVKMMLDGHTLTKAAALAGVSPGTAKKWLVRSPAWMQVVDVVFHDDLMRLRTDNGPANRAAVKHMGLNLIRNINDKASIKASIKVRRKTLIWDDQYLEKATTKT